MIATIALLGTLLTTPHMEKVNFAHNFAQGQTALYDLKITGTGGGGDIEMNAAFTLLMGEKTTSGTNVTVKPTAMKMSMNGNDVDQSDEVSEFKYVLDEHGMPETINMTGREMVIIIPLVLCYLPNKELDVGDSFDVDFEKGDATVKGTGKFEGMEKVGEKSLPKLSIKSLLHAGQGNDSELTYTSVFDPATGRIALIKGTAVVGNQEFNFELTKK